MKKIYFIRHGESEANLEGIWAGLLDSPLTKLGRQQAEKTGTALKNLVLDKIISSTLLRAKETSEIICRTIGYDINLIELDSRIAEYDLGILSGQPKIKISSSELVNIVGAEKPELFRERVYEFLIDLNKLSSQNILVVGHSGVQRMLEVIKNKLKPEIFIDLKSPNNAEIIEYNLSEII